MMPSSMRDSIALQRTTAKEQSNLAKEQRKIVGDLQELPDRISENFDAAIAKNQAFMKEERDALQAVVNDARSLFVTQAKAERAGNFMGAALASALFFGKLSWGADAAIGYAALGATVGKIGGAFLFEPIYWIKDNLLSPCFTGVVNFCAPCWNRCRSSCRPSNSPAAAPPISALSPISNASTTGTSASAGVASAGTKVDANHSGSAANGGIDRKYAGEGLQLAGIHVESIKGNSGLSSPAISAASTSPLLLSLPQASPPDSPLALGATVAAATATASATGSVAITIAAPVPSTGQRASTPLLSGRSITANNASAAATAATRPAPKRSPSPANRGRSPSPARSTSPATAARRTPTTATNPNRPILPLASVSIGSATASAFSATAAGSDNLAAPTAVRPVIKRTAGSGSRFS